MCFYINQCQSVCVNSICFRCVSVHYLLIDYTNLYVNVFVIDFTAFYKSLESWVHHENGIRN